MSQNNKQKQNTENQENLKGLKKPVSKKIFQAARKSRSTFSKFLDRLAYHDSIFRKTLEKGKLISIVGITTGLIMTGKEIQISVENDDLDKFMDAQIEFLQAASSGNMIDMFSASPSMGILTGSIAIMAMSPIAALAFKTASSLARVGDYLLNVMNESVMDKQHRHTMQNPSHSFLNDWNYAYLIKEETGGLKLTKDEKRKFVDPHIVLKAAASTFVHKCPNSKTLNYERKGMSAKSMMKEHRMGIIPLDQALIESRHLYFQEKYRNQRKEIIHHIADLLGKHKPSLTVSNNIGFERPSNELRSAYRFIANNASKSRKRRHRDSMEP